MSYRVVSAPIDDTALDDLVTIRDWLRRMGLPAPGGIMTTWGG